MKQSIFTLESTRALTADTYELVLSGDCSTISAPGQFVNIALPGRFLRRPISVCAWTPDRLLLIIKAIGEGTKELVRQPPGTTLDVLSGLGNGFHLDVGEKTTILAGGGVGAAPLYGLAQQLLDRGSTPAVVLGFRTEADAFYLKEFSDLGCQVMVSTEDGSLGIRGFVTDCIRSLPERGYVFACGPVPMLRAVHQLPGLQGGQFSFEGRMACGFGACMGCTIQTAGGPRRVCKEGPVFQKEEILW